MKGLFPWLITACIVGIGYCAYRSAQQAAAAQALTASQTPSYQQVPGLQDILNQMQFTPTMS